MQTLPQYQTPGSGAAWIDDDLPAKFAAASVVVSPAEYRVDGIEPVDGWHLCCHIDGTSHTTGRKCYVACRDGVGEWLDLSAHDFTPTQARWEWFVRAGFPLSPRWPNGIIAPWSDDLIDAQIRAEDPGAMRTFLRGSAVEFAGAMVSGAVLLASAWVMVP